jgi:hypothetical protein
MRKNVAACKFPMSTFLVIFDFYRNLIIYQNNDQGIAYYAFYYFHLRITVVILRKK